MAVAAVAAHYDSGSEDEFHSLSVRDEHDDHDDDHSESGIHIPPVHPIPSLQGAFEESIYESTRGQDDSAVKDFKDAEMRRRELLDPARDEDVRQTRGKQKTGAKYHPLLKLMAQIVFGMHLLQQSQAKSSEEVVKILQNHVNDVDSFLERTSEDFELAITDIEERIRYLKLPMQHMEVFSAMLDEKKFRTDIVNGNDKIEVIVGRTAKAMNDALYDISSGLESTKELGAYLSKVERDGMPDNAEIADVFAAMRGNEHGWIKYLQELRIKGESLGNGLVALQNVIAEINKHAAAASRRNKPQSRTISPSTPGASSPALRSKFAKDTVVYRKPGPWLDKPLPSEPESNANAVKVSTTKPHPVPFATRYEQPRECAPTPRSRSSSNAEKASPSRRRGNLRAVSGPLSSNPPDIRTDARPRVPLQKPGRSQSQTTAQIVSKSSPKRPTASSKRSRSQGTLREASKPSKVIPRKPVAGTAGSHSGTQIKYVPPSGTTPPNDFTSITNGFSRRVSKKLRNIPPLLQSRQRNEPVTRPVDSAYSSDRKRSTSSPTQLTMDTEHDIEKKGQTYFEKDAAPGAGNDSAGSRLGLFPKDTGPLTPSQASMQSRSDTPHSKVTSTLTDPSPNPTHPSKVSRTISIGKIFGHHSKKESCNIAAH